MKKLLYFFLPLLALVACTEGGVDDNNNPQPQPETKIPINISTSITRANDTEFDNDDKIGIYVVNQPNALASSGNHVDNAGFTYSGEWTPDKEIYWKDQTTKADFYAYYPYSATVNTSAHSFSVKTDQREEEDYWASDFLWGKTAGVTPTATAVPITVNHLLSNILVYIKAGEGFADESLATANISVKINNVKTSANIDLSSGVATAEGKTTTITPWDTGEYYRAMVVPQTIAEGTAFVVVTVDNTEYTFTSGMTLLANKQHKIQLTIDKSVGGVDVGIGKWDVVDENFDGSSDVTTISAEIQVTATCEEAILKTHVYSVFQDAIESFTNEDGVYVIKLKEGYTAIPDNTFKGSKYGLTNVIIGNGITSIGAGAFSSCDALTSVTIPESVTSIGDGAFSYCTSVVAFYGKFATEDNCCLIVDGALRAFARCSGKTVYVIPNGVTSIGGSVFSGCTSLTSVTIPDSVTSIGDHVFCDCTSLTSVTIPDSVTSIGDYVFPGCTSLTSVNIPDGVTEIGYTAFSGCHSLTSVNIPEGVTSIGVGAFEFCYSLRGITIPESVTSIGGWVFEGCSFERDKFINNSSFNDSDDRWGKFRIYDKIQDDGLCINGTCVGYYIGEPTNVTIPDGITCIGSYVFKDCTSLTSVTLPNSLISILSDAFNGCTSLTSVTIPENVTEISWRAFDNCDALESVYCKPSTPPQRVDYYDSTFGSNVKQIYVPIGRSIAYRVAWGDYASIIEEYDFENNPIE